MRIIKFRGKSTEHRDKWLYGNLQVPQKEGVPYYMWHKIDGELFQVEVWENTIGQFTGLYDKNGKEIYEGDILAFDKSYTDFKDVIEVRFVRGMFAFLWNGNLDDECSINSLTREWANVIGNIHDNPELLDKE